LTEEEYRQLEENILRDGCRDALVVWAEPPNSGKCPECGHDVLRLCKFYDVNYVTDRFGHESKEYEAVHEWICGAISDPVGSEHFPETPLRGDQFCDMDEDGCGEFYPVEIECLVLIDGHNRMKICEQHGLSYRWDNILTFRSRDEAKAWIIRNQFGRRNIQPYQRAELALELEPLIAKKAKENQERSGREFGKGCQKSDEPIEPVDTKREVAKVAGLSHDTIAKAKKIRTVMKIRSLNMFDKSFFESLNSHYADYCKKHKAAAATVYISISDFESPVAAYSTFPQDGVVGIEYYGNPKKITTDGGQEIPYFPIAFVPYEAIESVEIDPRRPSEGKEPLGFQAQGG